MQKGQTQVLILAGIVILIAVVGGIFFLGRITAPKPQPQNVATSSPQPSPTPDETVYTKPDRSVNWKTYKNSKASFSFKYPSEWYLGNEELSTNHIKSVILASCDIKNQPYCGIGNKNHIDFGVRYIDKTSVFEGAENAEAYYQRIAKSPNSGKNKRFITVDNKSAIRYSTIDIGTTDPSGFASMGDTVVLDYNGEILVVTISVNIKNNNLNQAIEIFDQILSTFRFLD